MSKAAYAAWFIALALLAGEARAQPANTPPPAAAPPANETPPPAAVTPAPMPPPIPFAKRPFLELSTLRMLREKGVISSEEFERSSKELSDWLGVKGDDSMTMALGKFKTTIYGFIDADMMYHSTQSFSNDFTANTQVQKSDTYAGKNGRFMGTIRNSRLGFRLAAPDLKNLKASAVMEADFLGPGGAGVVGSGNQSEQSFFVNPVFRVRHAYVKLETPWIDILAGQTWNLVGYQPFYIPAIVTFPGTVGGLFGRTEQLRISHNFKSKAVNLEIAVAALRGAQRDSGVPEGQAGIRLTVNQWSGLHSSYIAGTSVQPLSIAVSGALRPFRVPAFSAEMGNGVPTNQTALGWVFAADAYIPLLPATKGSKSHSLSLMGEFSTGVGNADLYTGLSGGVGAPALNGASPVTAAFLDGGLGVYNNDTSVMPALRQFTLIGWTTYLASLEFFVPGTDGRFGIFGTYGHSQMDNAQKLFGKDLVNAATNTQRSNARRDHEDMIDAGFLVDIYPGAVRLAVDYQYLADYYVNSVVSNGAIDTAAPTTVKAENHGLQMNWLFFF